MAARPKRGRSPGHVDLAGRLTASREQATHSGEQQWNAAARFLPQIEQGTLPAVTVAGCMVFAYISDGQLCVAVDLDDADPRLRDGPHDEVHVRISVQGTVVSGSS